MNISRNSTLFATKDMIDGSQSKTIVLRNMEDMATLGRQLWELFMDPQCASVTITRSDIISRMLEK